MKVRKAPTLKRSDDGNRKSILQPSPKSPEFKEQKEKKLAVPFGQQINLLRNSIMVLPQRKGSLELNLESLQMNKKARLSHSKSNLQELLHQMKGSDGLTPATPGSYKEEFKSRQKIHTLKLEEFSGEQQKFFIRHIAAPYFSDLFFGLIARSHKSYIGIERMKQYMGLPSFIGDRVVEQINTNGDERIDHDEFVKFFLVLCAGSFEQRMAIAFKCYDLLDNEVLSKEDVSLVLKNIPVSQFEYQVAPSSPDRLKRTDMMDLKKGSSQQIREFIEILFGQYKGGLYFRDFVQLATNYTGELFLSIFDCIHQYVPCVKNIFLLRKNYQELLSPQRSKARGIKYPTPKLIR